ncbi:hypothetical protein QO179_24585 [Bacillus stercoris]|nr:hypothetical protein [Bacillus stercoris]
MSDYIEASTHIDLTNQQLVFDSEGYYVVGDDKWQDITFTAKMIYNSGNIGIAPRVYDTNMFMFLSIHNETIVDTGESVAFANLGAQITYDTVSIAQQQIEPLVVGTEYIFKTEIKGTNYRIYLNDKMIFNIEYPGMSKGKIGVYSTQGNACKDIQVDSLFADGWTTNITDVPGAIVDIQELEDENKYLYISNDTKKDLYAEQIMPVIGGKSYTLSFQYKGIGKVQIFEKDGADPKTIEYDIPYQGVWGYIYFTNVISTDCTKIALRFSTINDKLMVNSVQLEDKTFATDYIQNDSLIESKKRENSIITYPSKDNIKPEAGSMSIWFKPSIDYSSETLYKPVLFEYGELNPLRLSYSPGELLFEYGGGSVSYPVDLLAESWYNVTVTWRSDRIQIYYDGDLSESLGSFVSPSSSPVIRIGNSGSPEHNLFFGVIDETIVFTNILSSDEVNAMINSEDPIVDTDSMIMRATFNYAIGNFNKSVVEATLAPSYGSPVLIEKADGTAMRKVSFFDFYTGEYRTFNEELVEYDKNYDYVTISYNDKDIDQETFKVTVKDAEGIIYGDPM